MNQLRKRREYKVVAIMDIAGITVKAAFFPSFTSQTDAAMSAKKASQLIGGAECGPES